MPDSCGLNKRKRTGPGWTGPTELVCGGATEVTVDTSTFGVDSAAVGATGRQPLQTLRLTTARLHKEMRAIAGLSDVLNQDLAQGVWNRAGPIDVP